MVLARNLFITCVYFCTKSPTHFTHFRQRWTSFLKLSRKNSKLYFFPHVVIVLSAPSFEFYRRRVQLKCDGTR